MRVFGVERTEGVSKDLRFLTSLVAVALLTVAVGSLAQPLALPSASSLTDAPDIVPRSIPSPTPDLRDAPVFPSPDGLLPEIESTSPADEELGVPWNTTVVVRFRSPVDPADLVWTIVPKVEVSQRLDATGRTLYLEPAAPFAPCTVYTVTIIGAAPSPVMNPWTFTTFCGGSIALTAPAGGEDWTGDSVHALEWHATLNGTAPARWTLELLAGGTATRIANGSLAGNEVRSYPWQVPRANLTYVRVRACITHGIRDAPILCDTSGAFTIDSTPPALVAHSPADGAAEVPLSLSLSATFSEPMDPGTTASAFRISPAATVASRRWTSPNVLEVRLEGLVNATSYAWGFRCSAVDRSLPGNPLADCAAVHDFTTTLRGPDGGNATWRDPHSSIPGVSFTLLSPVGGESWTGGSLHGIPAEIRNNGTVACDLALTASYRCAGGTCGGAIGTLDVSVAAGSTASLEIPWTLPRIDGTDVIVNLTASNATGAAWAEGGRIGIDSTPPTVLVAGPSGPHVRADPTLAVTFSERLAAGPSPSLAVAPDVSVALAWSPAFDGLSADLLGTPACTPYTATLGDLRDLSDPGNPVEPFSWTLATECLPSVTLLSPRGGEDWTGNAFHVVRWNATDLDDARLTLTLSYSLDGGADGFPNAVANGLVVDVGMGAFTWAAPHVDSGRVVFRIEVSDPAGDTATDASAAVFTLDSTPPRLLASFPGDGSATMWADRDVWFVFSERVDRDSFTSAFGLSPDPGNLSFSWSVTEGRDALLVRHDPFLPHRLYTASFATTAKDDSEPGIPLSIAEAVHFVATPVPAPRPPVALASGNSQTRVQVPAALDASLSQGTITRYEWRVYDGGGTLVAVLVGPKASYAFPRAGAYRILLTVTDAGGASDTDLIEIAVVETPDWIPLALAAAATLAAVGQALSLERGRVRLFGWFLVPLYARRQKDELLEHEKRGMIRGYILVHPGDSYTDIKRNLGLSNGSLTFHLGVLEREGIIRSQTMGTRKVFFPKGVPLPENGGNLHEVQLRILRAVRELPGIPVGDIAGALGISAQHALWHLRTLVRKGLVRFERHAFSTRCYPAAEPDKGAAAGMARRPAETEVPSQDS